jgi:hypothetical protein
VFKIIFFHLIFYFYFHVFTQNETLLILNVLCYLVFTLDSQHYDIMTALNHVLLEQFTVVWVPIAEVLCKSITTFEKLER